MKRFLFLSGLACLAALFAFLAVTRHLSLRRAEQLDLALQAAQSKLAEVESELMALRAQTPVAQPAQPAAPAPAAAPGQVTNTGAAAAPSSAQGSQPLTLNAQPLALARYTPALGAGITNRVRIEGTSTMHAWQVEGSLIGGLAQFEQGFPENCQGSPGRRIPNATVSAFIPVRSLTSRNKDGSHYSTPMDDILYEKLLANQFQRIFFTLDSLSEAAQTNPAPGGFSFLAEGRLAVAGVTNQLTLPVSISREQGSLLKFTGATSVRMTDFKITPPEPALAGGAIKTGDEVQLSFVWWTRLPKPSSN